MRRGYFTVVVKHEGTGAELVEYKTIDPMKRTALRKLTLKQIEARSMNFLTEQM